MDVIQSLVSEKPLVVFSKSSCCLCHGTTALFYHLGANVAIFEIDNEARGREVERALVEDLGCNPPVPAVFVGGELVGNTKDVNSLHLKGELTPKLIKAGVIWL